MLDLLGSMSLFLKPWTQCAEDGGEDAAPAEPEKDKFCSMTVCHGSRKIAHSEDHADALGETVRKGDGGSGSGSNLHVMPGDPDIDQDTCNGKKSKCYGLLPVLASGRDTEILPQGKKQKKQNEVKDHDSVVQRMSHPDETAQKVECEDSHRDHPCIPLSLP